MAQYIDEPQPLSSSEVRKELLKHPLWTLTPEGSLLRTFRAKNFKAAMDFIAAVGAIAQKYDHHPDIHIVQSKIVEVSIMYFLHLITAAFSNV